MSVLCCPEFSRLVWAHHPPVEDTCWLSVLFDMAWNDKKDEYMFHSYIYLYNYNNWRGIYRQEESMNSLITSTNYFINQQMLNIKGLK